MDLLREELPKSLKVGPLKDIKSQPGFTKPNSNGGHPIYRNDRNLYHDKVKDETLPVKDFYLGLAREAITTALPDWEFSCPSVRLMRSQRSGIEDIDKSPDFKDSKSRNIIAYGRPECDSAGRFIGPMLDAMKASPCYINLWSRENREMVMRANSAVLDKLGLVSQNMDAKNFDLSVSPELIACIESLHLDSFAAGEDLIGMREMYQNLARKLVAR